MASHTYTEDEFKQLLKNLFAEKKRVKELQKQIEEKGVQKKFQTKLADMHKLSFVEEYTKLKAAYLDQEKEGEYSKKQLEKVRPALKKLLGNLKSAHAEIATLKAQPYQQQHFKHSLDEANQKIKLLEERNRFLEEEKERLNRQEQEASLFQKQILQLQEELSTLRAKNIDLEEGHQTAHVKMEVITKILEEERLELARIKSNEQKEINRFESERNHLVEKLADTLSQVQRQADMLKESREELTTLHRKVHTYEQQEKRAELDIEYLKSENAKISLELARLNKTAEYQLDSIRAEKENLHTQVTQLEKTLKEQLQGSDLAVLKREYEAKLGQKESECEAILERAYVKMRELSEKQGTLLQERELLQKKLDEQGKLFAKVEKEHATFQTALKNAKLQCEDRDAEIRKAQQHLAKKVKEVTILRDFVERQNVQLIDLQNLCDQQKNEIELSHNTLNLHRMHEEKMHTMAKEQAQSAENLTKEWEEKYLSLQKDWQEKKAQLIEFQKMRKTYDQMATTVSSLKNILGHSLESPTTEDPQNSGN